LGFLGWNDSTSWDNLGHDSSNSLHTEGKWSNINQENIFSFFGLFATEDTTLDSSTVSNGLIWVNTSVWFFSIKEIFNKLLNLWDSGRTTNKYNFINFSFFHSGIFQNLGDWLESFLEKIIAQFFKSGSGDGF